VAIETIAIGSGIVPRLLGRPQPIRRQAIKRGLLDGNRPWRP